MINNIFLIYLGEDWRRLADILKKIDSLATVDIKEVHVLDEANKFGLESTLDELGYTLAVDYPINFCDIDLSVGILDDNKNDEIVKVWLATAKLHTNVITVYSYGQMYYKVREITISSGGTTVIQPSFELPLVF